MTEKRCQTTNSALLIFSACDDEHSCDGLGRHASFSGFGIALLTLFRISTGDNWNGIMKVG